MKKEISEALTTKFPGVSVSILDRIATKLAETVTSAEQVKTAVEGVTIQQVIESYGDSRATEASNTARKNAVKDYESRYGLKDGVKTTTGGDQPAGGSATDPTTGGDETAALLKQVLERMDKMEASKTTETRTQQLNAVIGKLPEPMRKAYERIPVDKYSDEDFSKMLSEISTEVEGIADDTAAKGGVFGKPSASTGAQNKTELTEAQKAAISRREGIPASDGQPF